MDSLLNFYLSSTNLLSNRRCLLMQLMLGGGGSDSTGDSKLKFLYKGHFISQNGCDFCEQERNYWPMVWSGGVRLKSWLHCCGPWAIIIIIHLKRVKYRKMKNSCQYPPFLLYPKVIDTKCIPSNTNVTPNSPVGRTTIPIFSCQRRMGCEFESAHCQNTLFIIIMKVSQGVQT